MAETALKVMDRQRATQYAIGRILDSLMEYIRVDSETGTVYWVTGVDKGPGSVLLEHIQYAPQLWSSAVPDECCIVSKKMLTNLLSDEVAIYLAKCGVALVHEKAARVRYDADYEKRI